MQLGTVPFCTFFGKFVLTKKRSVRLIVANAWKIDMRKALLTVIIALATGLSAWAGKTNKVQNLVDQYKDYDGFEVVSLGRVGTSLIKGVVKVSADMDEEDRKALKVFSGIKRLTIVGFEDAQQQVKDRFAKKLDKILEDMELIMEINDSGECVRFYGVEDGSSIKDCIMYSSNCALIITEGAIDLEKMGQLMELQK